MRFLVASVLLIVAVEPVQAQLGYRPGGSKDDPFARPRDLSGFSVRGPLIHICHTDDASKPGGSMYLQQIDPWLGYLWGRELTQREFTIDQGVFGDVGKPDGLVLPDGVTHVMSRDHVNSCMVCHNTPYRDGGAGVTIAKNGGTGRNTPHLFGVGLIEMIGAELRLAALRVADDNRDGWIDLLEAKDRRFVYDTSAGESCDRDAILDFGRFDDFDLDGQPDLNPIFYCSYVDGNGDRIPWAERITDPGVMGYRIEVQVFGHARHRTSNRPPIPSTIRGFTAAAFDIHQGLQVYDPTTLAEQGRTGIARLSNAGCPQFVSAAGRDRGRVTNAAGLSLDDPDRDNVVNELTEGDLDVVEWYLLNHPRPGRGRISEQVRQGEVLFREIGCTRCHTPDWSLPAADPAAADYTRRHAGDRRFFDMVVSYSQSSRRLEGKLLRLYNKDGGAVLPSRSAFVVRGIYSDFRYHDLGPGFHQVQYDGTVVRQFKTAPLWGVGSTGPYGHDGASLDLETVILRHGGEAGPSRAGYETLADQERSAILSFLRSLVLYQTDRLPTDINGDGRIDSEFAVAGQQVGIETLRPEWLLNVPCRIEGEIVNVQGTIVRSFAVVNLAQAYGLELRYLKDTNGDGWPDALRPTLRCNSSP